MTLHEFCNEFDNLTVERRRIGLRNFLRALADQSFDVVDIEPELYELMDLLKDFEQDDVFGTEGMSL